MFEDRGKGKQGSASVVAEERGLVLPEVPRAGGERRERSSQLQAPEIDRALPSPNPVATILISQGVWNGIGAVCASLATGVTGAAVQLAATVMTAQNEVREAKGDRGQDSHQGAPGYRGLLRDAWYSPGVVTIIGGGAFVLSAVQALAQGEGLRALVYGLFATGNGVVTLYANRGYQGTRSTVTNLEQSVVGVWDLVPARARNLLLNPGPWFGSGNLCLALSSAGAQGSFGQSFVEWGVPLGGLIVALGVGQAVYQAARGGQTSAFSVCCNAAANSLFSIAALLRGESLVALAQGCWTVSNLLLARVMRATRL